MMYSSDIKLKMENFKSHDNQIVEIPIGILPPTVDGILSKEILEASRNLCEDAKKVKEKDLVSLVRIAAKYKIKNTLNKVLDELENRLNKDKITE